MLLAIPAHIFGKHYKTWYFISYLQNTIGLGFSISTYYTYKGILPELTSFILIFLICLVITITFSILTLSPKVKPYLKLITVIVILCLLVSSIIIWVINCNINHSLLFYYLNISYYYMLAIITSNKNIRDLTRVISLLSFGAYIVISIIVVIIIFEGDAIESLSDVVGEEIIDVFHRKRKEKK